MIRNFNNKVVQDLYIIFLQMKNLIVFVLILFSVCSLPDQDRVMPPGMINQNVYSGFLKTATEGREIHYVFIQSKAGDQSSPLAIWLNGGPGCSSLAGMLQENGPFLVGNKYEHGELLKENPYSWNKAAHLLYLQSPAIVGFSTDSNFSFPYTDRQTGDDAFEAVKYFLLTKAPELRPLGLYITGQSYAGKYIPDIAVRIVNYNMKAADSQKINLKGLFIGNGVMDFSDNSLDKSEIEYMYEHDFLDDRLFGIYRSSCLKDFNSPRCQYFQMELQNFDERTLNPYYVYQVCKIPQGSQPAQLLRTLSKLNKKKLTRYQRKLRESRKSLSDENLQQIPECPGDDGAISYWNLNKIAYHVENTKKDWQVCYDINYTISDAGSMAEYTQLFYNGVKIWLYNGDWDDVVPYRDTEKNLNKLKASRTGEWTAWYYGEHHAGFYQEYKEVTVITVKGASHMVPSTKPAQAYQLFYNFINNRPVNTPV